MARVRIAAWQTIVDYREEQVILWRNPGTHTLKTLQGEGMGKCKSH
jgi:hypothetical protein